MPNISSLLVLFLWTNFAQGLIHTWHNKHDGRSGFYFIENFGFLEGGEMHITLSNFTISKNEDPEKFAGFLLKRSDTETLPSIIQEVRSTGENCWINYTSQVDENILIEGSDLVYTKKIGPNEEGLYHIFFASCLSPKSIVSFRLKIVQFNIDSSGNRNYLSAGDSPLPTMYGVFCATYVVCLVIWIAAFIRGKGSTVNRIHHLMTVLIVLKLLALFFKSIEFHFIKTTGSAAGWNVMYYIFAGLKGVMLFVLIALIGTGWTFIKPFLSEKDKKIFLVVIPLQILDNIALIIVEETAPGSTEWATWRNIFKLVDIICCGAILIPIIWSIKHLREGLGIDGKAALNIKKLKLFRQFYLMVVAYIYFTRIIVFIVDSTLPFKVLWLGSFFTELATLLFFTVTGYKFRPASDNPYFSLEEEVTTEEIGMTEMK